MPLGTGNRCATEIEWDTSAAGLCCWYEYNIDIMKRNGEALIYASKGIGLEVNTDNTKYMLLLVARMQLKSWH
jgi:diacylglycerol kinase family enzyme